MLQTDLYARFTALNPLGRTSEINNDISLASTRGLPDPLQVGSGRGLVSSERTGSGLGLARLDPKGRGSGRVRVGHKTQDPDPWATIELDDFLTEDPDYGTAADWQDRQADRDAKENGVEGYDGSSDAEPSDSGGDSS